MTDLPDALNDLESQLSDIIGADLAESLVKAALNSGELTLDLQLAMNDGLEMLTNAQRKDALRVLDTFKASLSEENS